MNLDAVLKAGDVELTQEMEEFSNDAKRGFPFVNLLIHVQQWNKQKKKKTTAVEKKWHQETEPNDPGE